MSTRNLICICLLAVFFIQCNEDGATSWEVKIEDEIEHAESFDSGWTQVSNIPDFGREMPSYFTIEHNTYFAGGRSGDLTTINEVWKYQIITNDWVELSPMPYRKAAATYFAIGTKGYILGGFNIENQVSTSNDFLEFDPTNNNWSEKEPFPGDPIQLAGAFTIGNKAYVLGGVTTPGNTGKLTNEVWMYDQSKDAWTRMNDFPGEARFSATAFASQTFSYFGLGTTVSSFINKDLIKDFWKYDPRDDTWSQITDYSGEARYDGTHFVLNNAAYIGMGISQTNDYLNDFYKLDFDTDNWERIVDFPGESRLNAVGFTGSKIGYIGFGKRLNSDMAYGDIWAYKE